MKNLNEILGEKLIEQIKSDNINAKVSDDNGNAHPDVLMFYHWAYKVPKGWYGFALGKSVPLSWTTAIGRVLNELLIECPNFEINQIKLKFGGLRFYVDLKLHKCDKLIEINKVINDLETLCFSKGLIY